METTGAKARGEELLPIVAHDLRNPIACIQGYAELLLARDPSPAERKQMLDRIVSCSRFAERIVEDLLDAEAAERGELSVKPRQAPASGLLRRAVELAEHCAQAKGVRLTLRGPDVDAPVLADPARIVQVLQNLLANAIRHSEAGTGAVEVRLHEAGEELVVEVSDNGRGIAPERLKRIFEKFYRGDEESGRGSLGLGLYIARSIVAQHGGRLWARSAGPGKGASFYFSLPKYDPEAAYREHKRRQGCATPPPRRLSEPAGPTGGTRWLAGLLGLVGEAARRWGI